MKSEGGRDWSRCMIDYLERLAEPYVLLMLDDFFLRRAVPTNKIMACLDFARNHHATQVRLIPRPKPTRRIPNETIVGEAESGSPYRLSTQAAIWDRVQLHSLLRTGESIWQFEHEGNVRVNSQLRGFYSTWAPILPYEGFFSHHVVEKGLWFPHEKWIFAHHDIGCDFGRRGTLGTGRLFWYHSAQFFDKSLDLFGWRIKQRVKRKVKVLLQPILRRQLKQLGGKPLEE